MKAGEAIKQAMKGDGLTQIKLAEKLGYKGQAAVGNVLTRENAMKVESLLKMAHAMGYDVVIRRGKEEIVVTE
jgi:transcriptional regulator with XRE-family HTH domain